VRAAPLLLLLLLLACSKHPRERPGESAAPRASGEPAPPTSPARSWPPDPALAPAPSHPSARAAYAAGVKAYQLEAYDDAVRHFTVAYQLDPRPALLHSIARAHDTRGDLPRARDFYRRHLAEDPDSPRRAEVEARLRELDDLLR